MIDIFFFQAEDGIRDYDVTGVQTCALPISVRPGPLSRRGRAPSRSSRLREERGLPLSPVRFEIGILGNLKFPGIDRLICSLICGSRHSEPTQNEKRDVKTTLPPPRSSQSGSRDCERTTSNSPGPGPRSAIRHRRLISATRSLLRARPLRWANLAGTNSAPP